MMYKAKVAVCSEVHTKHSTQNERHVEFWMLTFQPFKCRIKSIYHFIALVGARHILDFSRVRVKPYRSRDAPTV